MLSVSKLSPGQEAYYERSVAAGLEEYYAGRGESPGVWVGRGAQELELVGLVGDGELGRLIGGRHPLTSALLRSHPPKKRITIERIDPATGARTVEEKTLSPVAGYDLVFSPPKSVSLLQALGSDQVRHAVDQAHLAAWQAALVYLGQRACVTRRGKNGVVRERGSGFVAAAYQHRTSRARDPHLHTHVIVANLVRGPDGEWRALDGEPILKHYRLAAGYLYQAQLRYELTRSLGVEWRQPEQGMAEIAGVPDAVLRAFSQRRAQVLDYLARRGTSGFYAAKVAAIETRDRKEPIDLPRLRQEWQARAAEHGLGRRQLKRLLGRTVEQVVDLREVCARLAGPEGLTEKRSSFTGADAVMAWAQVHVHGAPAGQVLEEVAGFIRTEEIAPVSRASVGRPATFSTADLLRQERAALSIAARSPRAGVPVVSAATVEQVARERPLADEQVTMLRAVAASERRVVCVVGPAGSGKTTALAALADAFARDGYVPLGAAPSGVAAANLSAETGVPTGTLHRLLAEARQRGGLPRRCLLVVDEAGMADTRTLTRLLFQVEYAKGKAVLVGDPAQLAAVGPGGLFAALVERNGAIELHDNHRQRDKLERRALTFLREGRSRDYLAHAAAHGRLAVAGNRTEAKARLIADWWDAARVDLDGSVMIAYRRADVAELNQVARSLLDQQGKLGHRRLRLDNGFELAAGDRILCTRNDRDLALANGSRATVVDVKPARREILIELDDGKRVTLPHHYLARHVGPAYALTGHKVQGLTVERAFVLADDRRALKEWGYVALSRARAQTRLYTVEHELEPDAGPHRAEPDGPVDRLAQALARPAAQGIALAAATTRSGSPTVSKRTQLTQRSRQLAERQRALENERMESAREMHRARRELEGMGPVRRARRGRALRERIDEGQETLARLDRELEQLDAKLHSTRQRAFELARDQPRPQRNLTRGRSPQRSQSRGLEL